ncbi:galactinol synthase 2-like protein [Tanacetum coccineum]
MAPPVANNDSNMITSGLVKAKTLPRRAYVTFLAGDGDYWKGVVALAKGLRKAKSVYPLVVAILPDVPMDHQYSKMIYLDGDIQVFDNIDHLFDMPDGYFYAVMDCFCERNWRNSPQYQIGYCQQSPEKVQWPFRDIYKPIPTEYNLILAMLWRHPENFDLEKVKVVHYCADGSKPWRYSGKEVNMDREDIKMLVKKWWDIYNDESLDYWRIRGDSMPLMVLDKPTPVVSKRGSRYVTAPSAA